jgi:hypothetical protein
MAFRDILKQNRQQGSGLLSSMAAAASSSTKESLDIRNTLFKSGSLMNAFFPNVKGYQYKEKTSRLKTSPELNLSSDKLDNIAQSTSIAAKNSIVLPSMARDMFLVKQNIIKMVKLQGGKPTTKSGDWFARQAARENQYESQFAKRAASTTPTPVGGKQENSGMGLFTTLALISGALMLFGDEVGKTIGKIAMVGAALVGLKIVIGSILALKGLASLTGVAGAAGAAGKGAKSKIKMPGLMGTAATVLGLGYLNNFAGSSDESTGGGAKSLTTTDKVVAGGVGALGAYSTYKGVQGLKTATGATKDAIMDAKTMSVSQLSKSQPETRWGKFLAFVAKKSPTLWGKIGLKLAQAGALAAIPIVGWIGAAINLGFGLWTAWELYELWKEFSGQEDASDTSPSKVGGATSNAPAASSSASTSSPSPVSEDGLALLNKVMDQEGIKDPQIRNRIMNLAQVESSMNPNARGPVLQSGMHKGDQAHGLLQVMPKTAGDMGFSRDDIQNPEKAALAGVRYFMKNYKELGSLDAATVAHHAGPGKAREFLKTGSVSTKDQGTGLSTMNYLAKVSGSPGVPGSAIAASSTAVADGRSAMAFQPPVIMNSPQTINNVSGGSGSGLSQASSVFDTEFGKLLIERSVG